MNPDPGAGGERQGIRHVGKESRNKKTESKMKSANGRGALDGAFSPKLAPEGASTTPEKFISRRFGSASQVRTKKSLEKS